MKCVYSALQRKHQPKRVTRYGRIVPHPETPDRIDALLEGVRLAGGEIFASRSFRPEEFYKGVHSLRHVHFLKNILHDWEKELGFLRPVEPGPRPVVRPATYPRSAAGRAGWHMFDTTAPVVAGTWEAAKASADTALTAAYLVLKGEGAVYALCRPPGHHAGFETCGGFCYLNNTALAAELLRGAFPRVAILDIDVHHGNGTQDIFYGRADVFTVSIHADPRETYPFFWGHEHEVGQGAGYGFNLNIPLEPGSDDEVWTGAVEYACRRIEAYRPQALVVALGLDMMEGDALVTASRVTPAGVAGMARRIRQMHVPTVIVQEGGYAAENLRNGLAAFLHEWQ